MSASPWDGLGVRQQYGRRRVTLRGPRGHFQGTCVVDEDVVLPEGLSTQGAIRWLLQTLGPLYAQELARYTSTNSAVLVSLIRHDLKVGRIYTLRGRYFIKQEQ